MDAIQRIGGDGGVECRSTIKKLYGDKRVIIIFIKSVIIMTMNIACPITCSVLFGRLRPDKTPPKRIQISLL